jgi:small basic protein
LLSLWKKPWAVGVLVLVIAALAYVGWLLPIGAGLAIGVVLGAAFMGFGRLRRRLVGRRGSG